MNYVESHPDLASKIGVFWNTNSSFMINTSIFGNFVKKKPNSINRNFRAHDFTNKKVTLEMREHIPKKFSFINLPDQRNWFERRSEGFTKQTTEPEAIKWKYKELNTKKSSITSFTKNSKKIGNNSAPSKSEIDKSKQKKNNYPIIFNKDIHNFVLPGIYSLPQHKDDSIFLIPNIENDDYGNTFKSNPYFPEQENNLLFSNEPNDDLFLSSTQTDNLLDSFKFNNYENFNDCIIPEDSTNVNLNYYNI